MNLHKLIFTECDSYKAGKKITLKGIMVHSTGANNPNLWRYVGPDDGLIGKNKYNNHWNMPKVGASVHAFIGKLKDGTVATYQVLPWNYKAGHCYKGENGSGNDTHIAFEICEDGLEDASYFKKVYQEAVELTAMLCKQYNLDPLADGVVIDHSEGYDRGIASNHGDVMHWFLKHGKSMDTFRKAVKAAMGGVASGSTDTPAKAETAVYRVQVGAYSQKQNAEDMLAKLKKAGFDGFIVTAAQEAKANIAEIVEEVLSGNYGNGAERKQKLTEKYGADIAQAVQTEINKMYK